MQFARTYIRLNPDVLNPMDLVDKSPGNRVKGHEDNAESDVPPILELSVEEVDYWCELRISDREQLLGNAGGILIE
jgi:hypothetical protein